MIFKYNLLEPCFPPIEQCMNLWKDIYERGIFTNGGFYSQQLELEIQEYLNVKNAILVSNGTLAIMLAIKALGITKKVLVPAFTFPATVSSLTWMNITPKFVDINAKDFTINIEDLERKIDPDVEAILAVSAFGFPCDITTLESFARKNCIHLIFDSAPAFGARYENKMIGSFGDVECFSLHATKVLPTGEGGVITTDNDFLASKIRLYRNFGIDHNRILEEGINAKMSEFHAAIGYLGIKKLDNYLIYRNQIKEFYKKELNGLPITFQESKHFGTNQIMPILVDNRDKFANHLNKKGVQTRIYYTNLNETEIYKSFEGETPISKKIASKIICLPMHHMLSFEDVSCICRIIKEVFNV